MWIPDVQHEREIAWLDERYHTSGYRDHTFVTVESAALDGLLLAALPAVNSAAVDRWTTKKALVAVIQG